MTYSDELPRVIAESLRATREARGLSRREAALKTGVAERLIEAWERGERNPMAADMAHYLRGLGVLVVNERNHPRENLTHEGEIRPCPSLDDYDNKSR